MNKKNNIKNICMLSTHGYFDPVPQLGRTDTGGQVVYVLELSKALSKNGFNVDIYTRWFDKSKKQIDIVPGYPNVRVIRIPAGTWNFILKEQIYDVLAELVKNMIKFIKDNNLKYDLFHGHYVDAGIVAVDVAKTFNKPCFFTPHSLGAWKRDQMSGNKEEMEKKYNFKYRIKEEIRVFKSVNGMTLTTKLQMEKLNKLYNYYADNSSIISPGVDIYRFHPIKMNKNKKQIKTNLPNKYILCLSRIDTNKGHDLLLNAFDIVRKEIDDIYLVIGGGSPNPKQREINIFNKINSITKEKCMGEKVKIIGYVSDKLLVTYYQQSQLFVLPSIFEPFGMTATEAMACDKTVVASKFGGIRNIITNGENGLLVDPANPEEFANAIIKLLKNTKLRKQIGQNACDNIKKNYSWQAIANKHLSFYNKFMKS